VAQTLTINGSGFMSSSTVTYNSTAHTATFVSATQLTITLSTADQAMTGSHAVIVTNPVPGGGRSNTATFTVTPAVPAGAAVLIVGGQMSVASTTPLMSGEVFASAAISSAGNMLMPRYRPTASLVSPGGTPTVLIAGGLDANGKALKTAETYQGGAFGTATLTMQCAHAGHTATVLQDGRVLIAGRDGATRCAEIYDPALKTFTRTSGDMQILVSDHAAVLLQSGQVLIVGGTVDAAGCVSCTITNGAELYDPTTGMFTLTAHSLAIARSGPTATLLASGKVLIAGGGATPAGAPLKTAELYDPMADTFTLITSGMSVERRFHTATQLTDGKVLVAGGLIKPGSTATVSADLYDPVTNTFHFTGPMASARLYHTATILGNLVLIAGGTTQLTSGTGDSSAELYDPVAGVFALTGSLGTGRYGAGAARLQ
jgi:hypothetical protein